MKSKRQIIYERAYPYAQEKLQLIKVLAGDYDGSGKCHHVARNWAERNKDLTVSAVLSFVPKSGMNVHFVNKNQNGEYVDNTLGYLSKRNIYFLIKDYDNEYIVGEDVHMDKMLLELKKQFLNDLFTKEEVDSLQLELADL